MLRSRTTCFFFFQYDVTQTGAAGGGGEYDVQTGFGWSNGVVFEFIALFGDELLETDVDRAFDKSFREEIELNTHFDTGNGKSKLLKKDSNVSLLELLPFTPHSGSSSSTMAKGDAPICHHPALAIEEDEDEGEERENITESSRPTQLVDPCNETRPQLAADSHAPSSPSPLKVKVKAPVSRLDSASSDNGSRGLHEPKVNHAKNMISFFEKLAR